MGTGSPEEFEIKNKKEIKGKIVLCSSATSPRGKRVHRRTKYGYAVEYGVIGFIFMNHNPGQLKPTGSLRPAYRTGGEIPGIGVSLETGTQMLRLSKKKPLKIRIIDKSKVIPETESANIIFELIGNGSNDEWIIVGGHYDGHDISQGAMDNLSATAVIMELARVLKEFEGEFERNIRFILFACEELGVTGSTNYVAQHKEEMKKIAIMINLELGRLANKTGSQHVAFTFYQPDELKDYLEDFAEVVGYPMTINKGHSAASDHWPFYMKGVPTIYMHAEPTMQEIVNGRGWGHTSADTMDKVDHRNLQEGAMIVSRLLLRLANKKDKIAKHTSPDEIQKKLEKNGMRKILEIENKWHPNSVL
jgi:Zn-dependent M28 family amino/carboxypeptidase